MSKEKFLKVKILSNGRIPFINRNGPIMNPLSLSETIVSHLKVLGYRIEEVEEVGKDTNGNSYPKEKDFKSATSDDAVNHDFGKNVAFEGKTDVVAPTPSEDNEAHSPNVAEEVHVKTASPKVEPVSEETQDDIESTDEDHSTEPTSGDVEEVAEPFKMEVYNHYYTMNATNLRAELERIRPMVNEAIDEDYDIPEYKKDMLELVKDLIDAVNQ